jgi:hypothetical protein
MSIEPYLERSKVFSRRALFDEILTLEKNYEKMPKYMEHQSKFVERMKFIRERDEYVKREIMRRIKTLYSKLIILDINPPLLLKEACDVDLGKTP